MTKIDIFKPGYHTPDFGSAAMTFTSNRTPVATILVSNFTSAHKNIYSKNANWYKIFIEFNSKEQPTPILTSVLYYSNKSPSAKCELSPDASIIHSIHVCLKPFPSTFIGVEVEKSHQPKVRGCIGFSVDPVVVGVPRLYAWYLLNHLVEFHQTCMDI